MTKYFKTIRDVLRERFYLKVAIVSAVIFALVNWWLLAQSTTLARFFQMAWAGDYFSDFGLTVAKILSIAYTGLYWITTPLIIIAFGISAALLAWLFKYSRSGKAAGAGMGIGGTISALFASGCPVCGTFLFSLAGIAGGISTLPFKGLELKILGLGLMAGAVLYSAKKISMLKECESCPASLVGIKKGMSLSHVLIWGITIILAFNQFLIGSFVPKASSAPRGGIKALLGIQGDTAREIIATKVNPDGKTTSIVKQPTITEIPAEPKGMDAVEAAKVVMLSTGTPFYAPEGISFDDPVGALNKWQSYEKNITLSSELEARWQNIIAIMTCDYCCGSPARVTPINNCGCSHAKAFRSISKYILQNYGDQYSDEEILGELQRWKAIWYPKGVVEDYLLGTGRGDIIGHQNHGGAGSDGMHGVVD